jgi:homoserine O-acetyltransferase/O-succinyltransferase
MSIAVDPASRRAAGHTLDPDAALPVVREGLPVVREGLFEIPGEFALHHGDRLPGVTVAWRLAGAAHGPVVAVMGGISAGRDVHSSVADGNAWWNACVGPGRAVDSQRFRILGFDFLGGSGLTSGPRARASFPAVSSFDQAAILARLVEHLGLGALHAIVGASYGGMVALAFATRYGDRVGRLVVLSASHRAHPLATAWRSVERRMVRYAGGKGDGAGGLELARALAMITYRSGREFAARFAGAGRIDAGVASFPVEEYLFARGADYARSIVPEAFVCLSQSIDLHRIDPAAVRTPVTLVAIVEDQLVPIADMRALAGSLAGPVELVEVASPYGHDAFLKESVQLAPVLRRALQSPEVSS